MAKTLPANAPIAPPAPPPAAPIAPTRIAFDLGNFSSATFDGQRPRSVRSLFVELQPGQRPLQATAASPLIELDGRRYHVGLKAPHYNGFRAAATADKTDYARLFLAATLPDLPGDRVQLTVAHHSHELVAQSLKTALAGPFAFVRNGRQRRVEISEIEVIDEAIGAWHLACRQGQIDGWTLGIDIGAGTWLARVWADDGEPIAALTADKGGVFRLATAIAQDDRLKAPLRGRGITRPDTSAILDGLADGSHRYENTGIGWGDWWRDYRREWFSAILSEAKSEFAPHLGRITKILVTGGGANLISDLLAGKPGFIIPAPPHLAALVGAWGAASDA